MLSAKSPETKLWSRVVSKILAKLTYRLHGNSNEPEKNQNFKLIFQLNKKQF